MSIRPAKMPIPALAMLTVLIAGLPVAHAQTAASGSVDPVVADVVRMLDVGVAPDLVIEWVESSGRQPGPLSADDVIALSQAQAPKELIQALLELSARPPPAPSAPVPAPPTYSAPGSAPGSGAAASPTTGTQAGAAEDCCTVEVSIEYKAHEGYEGDRTPVPPRDLFVYVDGVFLARVTSLGDIAPRGPTRVQTRWAPGAHTVRLTRELHVENKDLLTPEAVDNITTVSPVVLTLTVEGEANYNLDMRWIESQFTMKRPLSWRWVRNGSELASEKHVGESQEKWPYLCEDVEASLADGAIAEWRAKDRMKGCVTWASLWPPGVTTTRQQVLEELARYDYDPPAPYIGSTDWGR